MRRDVVDLPVLAPAGGGGVVPVHRGDVVAVGAVLRLQLPVAVIDVGRRTAQHLQTLGRLVDDHVDDLGRFAEVLGQRHDIGVEAAEQEAAVALERATLVRSCEPSLLKSSG